MRSVLVLLLAFIGTLAACSKESTCKAVNPADEAATLEAYNASHGITATRHYSGLYYQVLEQGSNSRPIRTSTVYVRYTGKKLDGTVFDSASNPGTTGFNLSSLIEGWKIGLPMIGKGGRIRLTIPSSLAYGCVGSTGSTDTAKQIQPNTPLYFDIELEDFY